MSRTDSQVNFRLPHDLRQKLQSAANEAKRSLTAEMVMRLEHSFAADDPTDRDLIRRTTHAVLASLVEFGGMNVKTLEQAAAKAEAAMRKGAKRNAK